jgi:hypothetical protein
MKDQNNSTHKQKNKETFKSLSETLKCRSTNVILPRSTLIQCELLRMSLNKALISTSLDSNSGESGCVNAVNMLRCVSKWKCYPLLYYTRKCQGLCFLPVFPLVFLWRYAYVSTLRNRANRVLCFLQDGNPSCVCQLCCSRNC